MCARNNLTILAKSQTWVDVLSVGWVLVLVLLSVVVVFTKSLLLSIAGVTARLRLNCRCFLLVNRLRCRYVESWFEELATSGVDATVTSDRGVDATVTSGRVGSMGNSRAFGDVLCSLLNSLLLSSFNICCRSRK